MPTSVILCKRKKKAELYENVVDISQQGGLLGAEPLGAAVERFTCGDVELRAA